jgi:hypothetical protein
VPFLVSVSILVLVSPLLVSNVAWAQVDFDNDGISDSKENELATKYTPILIFADGEQFFPTSVNYHIDNSALKEKDNGNDLLIDSSPTIQSIAQYKDETYYLDNTLGGYEEITSDYTQKKESIGYIIYARVTSDPPDYVVQYWIFYAFNPGHINQHEGDWEMVQIVLDSEENPLYAVYSQHFSGERASWSDVEKDGNHPQVYVALGSHANYFRPYQGKLGLESDVLGTAFTLQPTQLTTILLGEPGVGNHPDSQDWIDYGGRWGDWKELADIARGGAGPRTPGFGENAERWHLPIAWGLGTFAVNQNWFYASWFVFYFLYIFIAIVALLGFWKIWRIYKRKREGRLNIHKILRSPAGIGIALAIAGIAIYIFAMIMPWYVVRANIQTQILQTVGEADLVLIDGVNGLRINTLEPDQGFAQLFGIGIPFAIILLVSVVLSALDIIGLERARELSRKNLVSGITTLIPVILIILFVTMLATLLPAFAGAMGQELVSSNAEVIAEQMSSSPIQGSYSSELDTYGSVDLSWGLGIGSYLFIVSAVLKFAAWLILIKTAMEPPKQSKEGKK